jgi:hypothetical protein
LDLVPADNLLCWYGRPLPDLAPPGEQPSTLQTLLELGTRVVGQPLDPRTQLWMRSAEMFNLSLRFPHALALLDVKAKPTETDPTARRMDRLRFALVVDTQGQVDPFLRVIQKTVNEQTDAGAATLTNRRVGGWTYQELRDRRLPDWTVIAWGHIDGQFVLTVGAGVWPSIAAVAAGDAPSLSRDPWFAAARRNWGQRSLVEIFVAAEEICRRLDPLVGGRATAFFRAWDAEGLQRAHWALGLEDRAMFCVAHFLRGDDTFRREYADGDPQPARLLETVPTGARYAVYRLPVADFVGQLAASIVALQEPRAQWRIRRGWARMEAEQGFDVRRDLLGNLGDALVLHNDPPHPLRLPLAMTVLAEITGDPVKVRDTVELMFAAFDHALTRALAEDRGPPPWTIHRDADDVWYIGFGPIAGPAVTVTDRYVVLSWSPQALRSYLARIGDKVGAKIEVPTEVPPRPETGG